jgi:hypothetical protein
VVVMAVICLSGVAWLTLIEYMKKAPAEGAL